MADYDSSEYDVDTFSAPVVTELIPDPILDDSVLTEPALELAEFFLIPTPIVDDDVWNEVGMEPGFVMIPDPIPPAGDVTNAGLFFLPLGPIDLTFISCTYTPTIASQGTP